jgi:hypothetical protein
MPLANATDIEQEARQRKSADFSGRVMTLQHIGYDSACDFRAFYESSERATGIEPAFRFTALRGLIFP